MTNSPTEYLTPADIASECGATSAAVRRWLTAGVRGVVLRSTMYGGRWKILRSDLEAFLERLTSEAVPNRKAVPPRRRSEAARKRRLEATKQKLREAGINF